MESLLNRFLGLHLYKKIDFTSFLFTLKLINPNYKRAFHTSDYLDISKFPEPLKEGSADEISSQLQIYTTFMAKVESTVHGMRMPKNGFTSNVTLKQMINDTCYPSVKADYDEVIKLKENSATLLYPKSTTADSKLKENTTADSKLKKNTTADSKFKDIKELFKGMFGN